MGNGVTFLSTRGTLQPSLGTSEFILIFHFAPLQDYFIFLPFFSPLFFFSRALFLLSVCVTALFNIFMWSQQLGSSLFLCAEMLTDTIYLSTYISKRRNLEAESGTSVLNHVILHREEKRGGGRKGEEYGGREKKGKKKLE